MISIKGSVLRTRRAFVQDAAPDGGLDRVLGRLTEKERDVLTSLLASTWYLGPGGVHRGFLVPGDPQAFLAKAPLIYSYYYDAGRRDYEKVGEKEALLSTRDAETFSAPDCLTVVGWYRRALEMCGAASPRVVEEECRAKGGGVCRYRVTRS
jgi:hypothetical protein